MLWKMVKESLSGEDIRELHIENGAVVDCRGCSYKTCIHYFALTATANDPGSIMNVLGIDKKAKEFAENIKREIKK
jgi:hypothetical protein